MGGSSDDLTQSATRLPGWPVLGALTEPLPARIHLRMDEDFVYVCSEDQLVATASASIPLEALARLIRLAGKVDAAQR